jgi:hypothetical protein
MKGKENIHLISRFQKEVFTTLIQRLLGFLID